MTIEVFHWHCVTVNVLYETSLLDRDVYSHHNLSTSSCRPSGDLRTIA